jgi:proton-translocating NADH-quinone oxidoreductase chain N
MTGVTSLLHSTGSTGSIGDVSIASTDWLLILPELLILLGVLLVPFASKLVKDVRARQEMTLLLVFLSLASVIWMLVPGSLARMGVPDGHREFLGAYEANSFALFFKLVFLLVAFLVVLVSPTAMKPAGRNTEYYTLLLTATFGMMVVASARDLLTIFVGLETTALSSYVLAGYRRKDAGSLEASTKFVIIGALASSLTLYGISLLYAASGSLNIYVIRDAAAAGQLGAGALLAIAFLVAGFGFKVTSVPFHMWGPDVYHGAPDTVSALLAAGSKKMGFAAFIKVFLVALLAVKADWDLLIGIMAVVTMTVGNLIALRQDSIKRLLAWSSVAQAGYMLIAFPVGTQYALTGALFHILTHAVMKGGAFAIVAVLAARGISDKLSDWKGLNSRAPVLAFTMALIMLSMAGIPPLAGFASKFVLFSSAISAGIVRDNNWLIFLAVAGIVNSVISLGYYLRVVRTLYVDEAQSAEGAPVASDMLVFKSPVWIAMFVILLGVVLMGAFPDPFVRIASEAAAAVMGPSI